MNDAKEARKMMNRVTQIQHSQGRRGGRGCVKGGGARVRS